MTVRGRHISRGSPGIGVAALTVVVLALVAAALGPVRSARAAAPKGTISAIRIVGNATIDEGDIRRKIVSKEGRELDHATVEVDYRNLVAAKWFSEVKVSYDRTPDGKGIILIFEVVEMPVLRVVEFRGVTVRRMAKNIEDTTGLKIGARADHVKNQLAVTQIRQLYQEKGYELAEVRLLEGGKPNETKAIFEVFEGPKCKITGINFVGNAFVSDALLHTKIGSRTAILGLIGGTYHRDDVDEDARKLRTYYQEMGFFEVKVTPVTRPGTAVGEVTVEFDVWEGRRYSVRNLEIVGNKLLKTEALKQGLELHSGKPFIDSVHQADKKKIEERYGEIGCIDAQIEVEHRYTDTPGIVDLVYKIEEGQPYKLGHFIVRGNERTRDKVIRREAEMAGLVPGEPLNAKRIDLYKQRLQNLRYFVGTPDMGKPLDIKLVNRRPSDQPYGETGLAEMVDEVIRTRFQDPGGDDVELPPPDAVLSEPPPAGGNAAPKAADEGAAAPPPIVDPEPEPAEAPRAAAPRAGAPLEPPAAGAGPADPFGAGAPFAPPVDTPPVDVPLGDEMPPLPPGREADTTPPVGEGEPPGTFPSMPGSNMTDVGPDRQEPFPNRAYVDIVTQVEEAPTGRLMFGVGASSFQGLSGNFILHESNFDIFAIPRSFRELFSGQAFRGAGQDFRIDIQPGTLINRAVVSFRDPYLFDLPIGFGASGYVFSRWYQGQWTEQRGGGRFSLGRQFGTMTYADVAFRAENVKIDGFNYPAPAQILAVEGNTSLFTLRPSLRFDNRNDPFAPNKGQYVEFAFEQGWGTFTFPKATVEGRQYFTLWNRPDGTGKHILTTRGFFGITGRDTPVYENFFAGDFRSMRGFSYRGVGPRILGTNVGGIMSALGSVEYQFPLIASDKLQQVIFCDFGTVEADYSFTTIRAAVGTGLRIYLPQQMFGPLPLAFDLAFPVSKSSEDRVRNFTFFIGAFW